MSINLQRFVSSMNAHPPAYASDFEVRIFCNIGRSEDLTLRAENASLPGRSVATTESTFVGPMRKLGYTAMYSEVAITFILGESYIEKEFFDKWIDAIVGDHRVKHSPGGEKFNAGYYDDYKGTIEIQNVNRAGENTYKTRLIEAWPINMAAVALDWGSSEISKLNVTFAYRYYEHDENDYQGSRNDGNDNLLDFLTSNVRRFIS
jgi:hypothetical protein